MKNFIKSPYLKLFCGVILLISSGFEIIDSFGDSSFGAHHGVFVFGIIHILKSFPEIHEGLDHFDKANDIINN